VYEHTTLFPYPSGVAAGERCVSGVGDDPYFPPDRAEFITPHNTTTAYQVIIPGYEFQCYGKILEWSALTVYHVLDGFNPLRIAYFQVWRPTGEGTYTRVGYDKITVDGSSIQPSYTSSSPGDGRAFYNITSVAENHNEDLEEGEDNRPLYFQPGDIMGFFVRGRSLQFPLIMTYRNSSEGDYGQLVVDMFYTTKQAMNANDEQLCNMSECAEKVIKIFSVIPHIYFTYG